MEDRPNTVRTTIPADLETWKADALIAAGLKFGRRVAGDRAFRYVRLPAGWSTRRDSTVFLPSLLDEKGRYRAHISCPRFRFNRGKRKGYLTLVRRYYYDVDYLKVEGGWEYKARVKDGEVTIHSTESVIANCSIGDDDYDEETCPYARVTDMARAWLDIHFPLWLDPTAYWT